MFSVSPLSHDPLNTPQQQHGGLGNDPFSSDGAAELKFDLEMKRNVSSAHPV